MVSILSFLKQINWIDIFVLILLLRVCYIAGKTGFSTEIFKFLGTVCAIYLACHYYARVGNFVNNFVPLKGTSGVALLNLLTFFSLASLGYFIFAIIRQAFYTLIRIETATLLNRWGAFILGIARWSLLTSLLFFSVTISNIDYLKNTLSNSVLGPGLVGLAPKVYTSLWDNLISRFIVRGAVNQADSPVEPNPSK